MEFLDFAERGEAGKEAERGEADEGEEAGIGAEEWRAMALGIGIAASARRGAATDADAGVLPLAEGLTGHEEEELDGGMFGVYKDGICTDNGVEDGTSGVSLENNSTSQSGEGPCDAAATDVSRNDS